MFSPGPAVALDRPRQTERDIGRASVLDRISRWSCQLLTIVKTGHLLSPTVNGKGKRSEPITELWSVTCHMGSHSVTCHPTEVNAPRLNLSQIGQYSIYLSQRDGRLS